MNIVSYLRKNSQKSLAEFPFNEVDALIFAELSYINFQFICPSLNEVDKSIRFSELSIPDEKSFYFGSVDEKGNKQLVDLLRVSKRFSETKIGWCQEVTDDGVQFFAMSFILPDGNIYVSYRGTDVTTNGWKENCAIVFKEGLPSQKLAEDYLKQVLSKLDGKFIIGGHSKGGNLALYAAMHMGKENEHRLLKAYSFDGPGFIKPLDEATWLRLKSRLYKYMTNNDVVGTIFNRFYRPTLVYSTGLLIGGHDPFYWKVQNDKPLFIRVKKRSKSSHRFERAFQQWMDVLNDDDKSFFITNFFEITKETKTIYGIFKGLGSDWKNYRSLTKENRERLKDIFSKFLHFYFWGSSKPNKKAILKKKVQIKKIQKRRSNRSK